MTFLSQFLCRGDAAAVSCRSYKAAAVPDVIDLDHSSQENHSSIDDDEMLKIMVGDDKMVGSVGDNDGDDVSATATETEQEDGLDGEDEEAEKASESGESSEERDVREVSAPVEETEQAREVPVLSPEEPVQKVEEVVGEASSSDSSSSRLGEIQEGNEEVEVVVTAKKSTPPAPAVTTPHSQGAAKVIAGPPRTRRTAYDLSQLLGESLLVKNAETDDEFAEEEESLVDTNKALAGRAVVAVYIGSGQHKDSIALFDAGYDASSLAIVYGWSSTTDSCEGTTGFESMPNRWFMSEDYESMLEKCPEQEDEVLIVLDPWSGKVLCPNALPQLLALDPTSSDYDSRAEGLMQSWIGDLPMQQVVVGHMEIPLR